jgi:hypothetical protein
MSSLNKFSTTNATRDERIAEGEAIIASIFTKEYAVAA